jgi:hypothetical protein
MEAVIENVTARSARVAAVRSPSRAAPGGCAPRQDPGAPAHPRGRVPKPASGRALAILVPRQAATGEAEPPKRFRVGSNHGGAGVF